MKKYILLLALPGLMFLGGCNGGEEQQDDHDGGHQEMMDGETGEDAGPEVMKMEKTEMSTEIDNLLEHYLRVKEALVNTQAEDAKAAATEMVNFVKEVDASKLDEEGMSNWDEISRNVQTEGEAIANAEDVEVQRDHFEELSITMQDAIETFGVEGRKIYKEYCPMAFNNKGAYWFSTEEAIANPYFGEKMMKCGEVQRVYE